MAWNICVFLKWFYKIKNLFFIFILDPLNFWMVIMELIENWIVFEIALKYFSFQKINKDNWFLNDGYNSLISTRIYFFKCIFIFIKCYNFNLIYILIFCYYFYSLLRDISIYINWLQSINKNFNILNFFNIFDKILKSLFFISLAWFRMFHRFKIYKYIMIN